MASLREASLTDAQKVIDLMIGVNVQPNLPESLERWNIIFNVCLRRSQLFETYKPWLISEPEVNPITMYIIVRVENTQNWHLSPEDLQMVPENNKEMRDWMRQQIRTYCDKILPEQGRKTMIQLSLSPRLILWVTWPDDESELVESSVKAVDLPEVLVLTKTGPLQALAFLALRLPDVTANRICDEAVRWLHDGVPGREITMGGPHSVLQFRGANYGSVFPAVLFLADLALSRAPSRVGEPVANWLLQHGLRQSAENAHRVFLMMARLGLAPDGDRFNFIGISEVVVNQAAADDPTACVRSFHYLLAPPDGTTAVVLATSLPARRLLFRLWDVRLRELADHRLPSVRAEVALTIRAWQDLENKHPDWGSTEGLDSIALKLSKDLRAGVRHALGLLGPLITSGHP